VLKIEKERELQALAPFLPIEFSILHTDELDESPLRAVAAQQWKRVGRRLRRRKMK
jgi:hypothetical protein